MKSVSEKYGAKAEQLAREMAGQAKGKKIRNVEEALKTYEKYRADINKKINAKTTFFQSFLHNFLIFFFSIIPGEKRNFFNLKFFFVLKFKRK